MTRNDARMIAEELHKLMMRDNPKAERLLNITEAAAFLGLAKSTIYSRLEQIPHSKIGGRLRFTESSLYQYATRQ